MRSTHYYFRVNLPPEVAVCTGKLVAMHLGARLCSACNDNPQEVRQFARRIAAHAFLFARLADCLDENESIYLDPDEAQLVEDSILWCGPRQSRRRSVEISIGGTVIEELISEAGNGVLSERQLTLAPLAAGFGIGIRLLSALEKQLLSLAAAAMPAVPTTPMFHELVRAYERGRKPQITAEHIALIRQGAEAMLPYASAAREVIIPDVLVESEIERLATLLKRK